MSWTVKNVKMMDGHDGNIIRCTLYRDGVKVATCFNDGNGGEMDIDWVDRQAPRVDINVTISDYDAPKDEDGNRPEKAHTYRGTPEEKLLAEFANAQTEVSEYGSGKMVLRKDAGWVVEDLCLAFERAKRMKNKTGFILLDKNGREVEYTMNAPYTPEVKARLEAEHGDKLVRILNTEFVDGDEAEAIRRKKAANRLKAQCRTKTLYRLKTDEEGRYWICKRPYNPILAAQIRAKHGDNLAEIINESLAA